MAVVADTQRAVSVLQGLQGRLVAAGDPELGEQVAAMIDLLASPSFRHLLNLQQSVRQLKHHIETGPPGQSVEDYEFATNGDLILPEADAELESEAVFTEPEPAYREPTTPKHPFVFENKTFEGDEESPIAKTEATVAASAPPQAEPETPTEEHPALTRSISLERANQDLEQALRELALGREVVSIELMKPEGRGLGFSVVGLKSENQGELGIFVQQIQPRGVAARDGRLRESDQILAINGALVDSTVSHKQAIGMLQKVKDEVNLIVARGGVHLPTPTKPEQPTLPRVPEAENEEPVPVPDMVPQEHQAPPVLAAAAATLPAEEPLIKMEEEREVHMAAPAIELEEPPMVTPDIEVIDLYNQGSGLGFGIVGVRDIGIVVKTIVTGGAAEKDGRLQSGDIILRIGDTDLEGMNSDQVATVLRQSGSHVRLVVARGALSVMQPQPPSSSGPREGDTRLPPQGLDLGHGQMELEPHPVSPPPVSLEHGGLESGEVFEVELVKGSQGLGLSIAGFIKKTPEGETSGIFVKKLAEGSAADLNGNIKVGDQIIEVDGTNVQGYDNKAAVDLLRRTGAIVHLRLVRFPSDVPQNVEGNVQAQAAPLPDLTQPPPQDYEPPPPEYEPPAISEDEMPVAPSPFPPQDDVLDDEIQQYEMPDESFEGDLSPEEEFAIMVLWQGLLARDTQVVIAQLSKFHEGGSLGISLEGTVDIDEMGQEVQPHHYIRSILPDGPVGQNRKLNSGDELLEVNGIRLLGLNHEEVVKILKDLPQHVRLVCARYPEPVFPRPSVEGDSAPDVEVDQQTTPIDVGDVQLPDVSDIEMVELPEVEEEISPNISAEIQMAMAPTVFASPQESETQLDVSGQSEASVSKDSSMWSDEIQYIELVKGDRGLGFSILDYQDPANPSASVIVIRSLVNGGVAEQDGRLIPGDRLVSVNESNLENCSLDMAVQVLKGAPRGVVRIGVAKPVATMESEEPEVISAQPAVVEESAPPLVAPSPEAPTPMLPDMDISLMSTPSPDASSPEVPSPEAPTPEAPTPMLPDVDISPLAAAIMAKEAMEEAENEMEAEVEVKVETKKMEEPAIVAAEVSVAHSAPPAKPTPPPRSIPSTMPPDLVTSTTVADGFKAPEPVPEPKPSPPSTPEVPLETKPSPPEILEKGEDRLPKMVAMKATPPSMRRKSNVVLPSSLEQTIVLKKTNAGLGLTVSADKANGVVIKSIIRGGCVQQDGRLSVGDYITAVNGENMRNLNNNTARGVLRRTFLQGTDITVTYIPVNAVTKFLENASTSSESPRSTPPPVMPRLSLNRMTPESDKITPSMSPDVQAIPSQENQWGDVKTVSVNKEPGRSLGISIVGGRAGDGQVVPGIFIKHVLEDSPAGRTRMMKTGDRILEVNGCDLREATHDQAVAVIRNAANPMQFQVQSPVGAPAPILPEEPNQGAVVAVAATVVQAGMEDSEETMDRAPDGKEADTTSDSESEDEFGYTWKKVSQRYQDLTGELHVIELTKGDRGLGLSLAGNKDRNKISVFVVGVNPSGAAGKDGRILIGDEILEINGIKVLGHSHQNASSIIQGLAPGVAKLVLIRNPDALNQLAVPPVIYPNQTSIATVVSKPEPSDETDGPGAPPPAIPEEEAPMPSPEDYPNVQTITLTKGPRGLGFAIYENRDEKGLSGIFVKDVTMGGPAAKEGHLRVGDQILAVNDKSLIGLSKLSAITVLKDTRGTVSLTISSAKPFPGASLPSPGLFPSLDPMAGIDGSISVAAQPVVASEMKTQRGHGSTSLHSTGAVAAEAKSDPLPSFNVDPLTCPIVKGRETLIVIDRGDSGLGISIVGGVDTEQKSIMVHEVYPDGAAARDGRLEAGDQLLEVDGLELTSVTHDEAIDVLRQTGAKVRMLVLREDPPPFSSPPQGQGDDDGDDDMDVFNVVLHQPAGQNLGLSIAGRAGALYISDIVAGSPADSSGQLARGDQILAVNDQDVKTIPQEALATLRQNAEGDVNLKIARQKEDSGSSRLSMSSFETVVVAQPAVVDQSEPSTGSENGGLEARAAFIQQESFGSSTEMPPEETSGVSVKTIVLDRGPDGLGFSIVGGFGSPHGDLPIYIKTVFNKGAAAETKQLKRGDQILAVNGESLEGATHHTAVNILKAARGTVTLTVVA